MWKQIKELSWTRLDEVVGHDGAEEDDEAVARDGDEPLGLAQEPRAPRLQVAALAPTEVFEFLQWNKTEVFELISGLEWNK